MRLRSIVVAKNTIKQYCDVILCFLHITVGYISENQPIHRSPAASNWSQSEAYKTAARWQEERLDRNLSQMAANSWPAGQNSHLETHCLPGRHYNRHVSGTFYQVMSNIFSQNRKMYEKSIFAKSSIEGGAQRKSKFLIFDRLIVISVPKCII